MDENFKTDDAHTYLVQHLKKNLNGLIRGDAPWGTSFELPKIINEFTKEKSLQSPSAIISNSFFDVAWNLARQGIIRLGPYFPPQTAWESGFSVYNFSLTQQGLKWLQEQAPESFIFATYERYENLMAPYKENFGEAFSIRVKEAASCYQYCFYYASCTMAGAAAESILLSWGERKLNSLEMARKVYHGRSGRKELITQIKHGLKERDQSNLDDFTQILTYWRDEAGHGDLRIEINEWEAFEALSRLWRFAKFVHEKLCQSQ